MFVLFWEETFLFFSSIKSLSKLQMESFELATIYFLSSVLLHLHVNVKNPLEVFDYLHYQKYVMH